MIDPKLTCSAEYKRVKIDKYKIEIHLKIFMDKVKDDRDKVKAGDVIRYNYKNYIGIAKLIDINGELYITIQRESNKIDISEEILKLKDVTDVYILKENQIKNQLRHVKMAPPYSFFYDFITRNGNFEEMDNLDKFYYRLTNKDKFRILDIDNSIMDLILYTDNAAFFRSIFLPAFFINNTFEFGNYYIKGILIYQCLWKDDGVVIDDNIIPNDIRIYFVSFDTNRLITSDFDISLRKIEKEEVGTKIRIFFQEEKENLKEIFDRVLLIVCNVIDLIEGNKEELDIREIKRSPVQNEKRIKRGKIPIKDRIVIKPKRQLLDYIKDFEKDYEKFHYSHKFVVRGHWRHFRSERYKYAQGKKTWIRPYIKGEGLLIQKSYTLIDGREKE